MSLNKYQTAPKKKKKKALFGDIVNKNIKSKFRRVAYKRELTRFLWSNLNVSANLIGVSFHEALTVFPSVSSFLLLSR